MQLNRSYKYNENIVRTGISTLNGHISKPVALREKLKKKIAIIFRFWVHVDGSEIFHTVFLTFSAHMGLFSVIIWVLEVGHFCPDMPLGLVSNGEQKLLAHKK